MNKEGIMVVSLRGTTRDSNLIGIEGKKITVEECRRALNAAEDVPLPKIMIHDYIGILPKAGGVVDNYNVLDLMMAVRKLLSGAADVASATCNEAPNTEDNRKSVTFEHSDLSVYRDN